MTALPLFRRITTYMSDRLGHDEIWILHLDTKHFERLQLPGYDLGEWAPKWFPDGRKMDALANTPMERAPCGLPSRMEATPRNSCLRAICTRSQS